MPKTLARSALHRLLSLAPAREAGACVPILMYHSVDRSGSTISVTPENFRRQMRYFASKGWHSISLGQLASHLSDNTPLPPRAFVITFDDGFESVAREAWPVMREHGFSGTVFLATGYVNAAATWSGDPLLARMRIMDWESVRKLAAEGMEFGSHAITHPFLTKCSDAELIRELRESRDAIRSATGQAVDTFCYPYGDYNERVIEAVQQAGYRAATTIYSGNRHSATSLYALSRVCAVDYEPLTYYGLAARPGYALYIALKKENEALARQIERQRATHAP